MRFFLRFFFLLVDKSFAEDEKEDNKNTHPYTSNYFRHSSLLLFRFQSFFSCRDSYEQHRLQVSAQLLKFLTFLNREIALFIISASHHRMIKNLSSNEAKLCEAPCTKNASIDQPKTITVMQFATQLS